MFAYFFSLTLFHSFISEVLGFFFSFPISFFLFSSFFWQKKRNDLYNALSMHMQAGDPAITVMCYSMPFRSIWLAAMSMTLMMKAIAKAQMRLLRTHVCRLFFLECTVDRRQRNKQSVGFVMSWRPHHQLVWAGKIISNHSHWLLYQSNERVLQLDIFCPFTLCCLWLKDWLIRLPYLRSISREFDSVSQGFCFNVPYVMYSMRYESPWHYLDQSREYVK